MRKLLHKKEGFTLIELLVVIGIIAILAAVVIIAINPARQFAQARDTTRTSNINTILDAIGQKTADSKGVFAGSVLGAPGVSCPAIPTGTGEGTNFGGTGALGLIAAPTSTSLGTSSATIVLDLSCLTPTYIPVQLPIDPTKGTWSSSTSYNTYYAVQQDPVTNRITVYAPGAEISVASATR